MKLPGHPVRTGQAGRGFPEMKYYFIVCPFLPAGRQGPHLKGGACGALAGQRPKQRKERQDVFRNESKVFNF